MPTYQYECNSCGHRFEIMQSITDPKLKKCPVCQKNRLCRLIGTGSGIIFKGSGFYETDYKNKPCPESNSCPAASKKKTASGCGCNGNCGHNH